MRTLNSIALGLGWLWLAMIAGLLGYALFEVVRGLLHGPPAPLSESDARHVLAPYAQKLHVVPLTTHAPSLATADGAREDSTFDERQNTD